MDEIYLTCSLSLNEDAFLPLSHHHGHQMIQERKKMLTNLLVKSGLLSTEIGSAIQNIPNTLGDINAIYEKALLLDLKPRKADPGMLVTLRDYQEVALSFMFAKEKSNLDSTGLSPIWKVLVTPQSSLLYFNSFR